MIWEIELLYFIAMIVAFILLLVICKIPAGISLMISSIIGLILSAIFSKTDISITHLISGSFGYFDTILTVTTAMIFMVALEKCGALAYLSAFFVKKLNKVPTILLLVFMLLLMFPGMITGSSLSSIITSGAMVAPIMIKMGIPKAKVGGIVAFGAILGMIAPPINVPVMVICDVVDIAYSGFTLPLLALTIPLAIFIVIFMGRIYIKKIDMEAMKEVIDFDILKRMNWTIIIPFLTLVTLIILQSVFPKVFGSLGMPLVFVISTIPTFFIGNKAKPISVTKEGVQKSLSAMALLMGVGMFVEVFTLCGARGLFVTNAVTLPNFWQYVAITIAMPLFGGISAFGSASILGGPFVMAIIKAGVSEIILVAGLSMIASIGEFLPPTAMSATFASKIVGEKSMNVTKASIIPIVVTLVYALFFIIVISKIWL